MTIHVAMGIFGALIFMLVGIGGLVFSSKKKFLFLIVLLAGSWSLYIHTIGPLSTSKNKLGEIININSNEVQEIILKPSEMTRQNVKTLIQHEILIQDKKSIERICQTLNKAEVTYAGYVKRVEWLAQIEIKTQTSDIKFGIRKRGNITGLTVSSRGEYGWSYGTLECNELGQILENEIIK